MVSIQGLNGVPEPKPDRPGKVRGDRDTNTSASSSTSASNASAKDGVTISNEAKAAAEVGRVFQLTKSQSEIRADRVEAARQRIAEGSYRDREAVAKVAEKLLKLLG